MTARATMRCAVRGDLQAIVAMLADDPLGAQREQFELPLPTSYLDAFKAIDEDPNNELIIAEIGGAVAGVLQITYIPNLSHRGGWRGQIESVRIAKNHRGSGAGAQLLEYSIARIQARGCRMVQLFSDKTRADAIRFYERLEFEASHEGLKLHLGKPKRT